MGHPEHPEEALRPQHGGASKRNGTGWMDFGRVRGGGGVDRRPLYWLDYALNRMSSHNKGFIITSWSVAAVWELCASRSLCQAPKKCGPALVLVGGFKQQQTLYGSLCLAPIKQPVFQEGGNTQRLTWQYRSTSTGPGFTLHLLQVQQHCLCLGREELIMPNQNYNPNCGTLMKKNKKNY